MAQHNPMGTAKYDRRSTIKYLKPLKQCLDSPNVR